MACTTGVRSFPMSYLTDIKSLIVIPERTISSAELSPRKKRKSRSDRRASTDEPSRTETNDDNMSIVEIQNLLFMPGRANHIHIAPRPPENILSNGASSTSSWANVHNNVDITPNHQPKTICNIAAEQSFLAASVDRDKNHRHGTTDGCPRENLVALQRQSIHWVNNYNHMSNMNHNPDHKTTPSIDTEMNHHTSDCKKHPESPSESIPRQKAFFVSKDDINLVYDVILGRPSVNFKRLFVGRSDSEIQAFSAAAITTSNSFDTDRSSSSNCEINSSIKSEISTSSLSIGQTISVYDTTLVEWWEKYDLASHVDKVHVAKLCIEDMVGKGCRFLQKREDGTRNGFYTVVPPHDESIRKKVLRALRQVVLQRLEAFTEEECNRHATKVKKQRAYVKSQESKKRVSSCVDQIQQNFSMSVGSVHAIIAGPTEDEPLPSSEASCSPVKFQDDRNAQSHSDY